MKVLRKLVSAKMREVLYNTWIRYFILIYILGKLKWDNFQEKILDLCNLTVASAEGATVSIRYEAV